MLYIISTCLPHQAVLVKDSDPSQQIFEVLMDHGRSTLSEILRYSRLDSRQVKHSLAVLVQQNLAFWNTDVDSNITRYEANFKGAYSLVRSGKHIKAIQDTYGNIAASLFSSVMLFGLTRLSELEEVLKPEQTSAAGIHPQHKAGFTNDVSTRDKPSGERNDVVPTRKAIYSALHELLQDHHLSRVHVSHFHSEADNRKLAEADVKERPHLKGLLKGKQKTELQVEVNQLLLNWKLRKVKTSNDAGNAVAPASTQGKKRQLEDKINSEVRNKKQRLEDGAATINGTTPYVDGPGKFLDAGKPCLAKMLS